MKYIACILLVLFACACASSKIDKPCKGGGKTGFGNIKMEKFESVVNNDTIYLNEAKFECIFVVSWTKKVMFDKYGKWGHEFYPNNAAYPILVWENVKLFPDDTAKFNVAAHGFESATKNVISYASVIVTDVENNDLLSEDSSYKAKLLDHFSALINNNDPEKREFYDLYWSKVR